jgi:hypothetical protein
VRSDRVAVDDLVVALLRVGQGQPGVDRQRPPVLVPAGWLDQRIVDALAFNQLSRKGRRRCELTEWATRAAVVSRVSSLHTPRVL